MNQKLTTKDRQAIARLADAGVSRHVIADAYDIDESCVRQIKRGSWSSGPHGGLGASRRYNVHGVATTPVAPRRSTTVVWSHA